MMFGKRSYDYFKVFFHRPIWTELNVLFWKFLLISTFVLLCLTLLSVRYYNNYPVHRIDYHIKQNYLNRIVSFYGKFPQPREVEPPPSENLANAKFLEKLHIEETVEQAGAEIEPDVETVSEQPARGRDSGNKGAPYITGKVPESKRKYDGTAVGSLNSASESSAGVASAIGSIPSMVKPSPSSRYSPTDPYNARKKAYDSSVKELSRVDNENIDIAKSEFTDFEIATGTRDYENIIATANENKKYVKQCIDRITRNDPTMRGNLVVKFDIHPEGYVVPASIRVVESDIQDMRILNCIKRTIRRWHNFPQVPYEQGEYTVTQKYVF